MAYLRALLSLLTLFGGHFLNRRLDRVVMLAGLLLLLVISYVFSPTLMVRTGAAANPATFVVGISLPLALIVVLALISTGLTFLDARGPARESLSATMKVTGVAMSMFGLLVGAAATYLLTLTIRGSTGVFSEPRALSLSMNLQGSVDFGGSGSDWDLPEPPSGDERLRGRVMFDGAGAEGVHLSVLLNGKYRSPMITDANGAFEIALPAGTWYVNRVSTTTWKSKPEDRELSLYSHVEPRLSGGNYSRHNYRSDKGLEIRLPQSEALTLELRDDIAASWPPRSNPFSTSAAEANFESDTIAWKPVPSAATYEVQIAHVTREGTTTSYRPILQRRQSTPALPLASLPRQDASEKTSADEYSVTIYAFDAQGSLISESSPGFYEQLFQLSGPTRLAKDAPDHDVPEGVAFEPGGAHSDEYVLNALRLSRASKLLDQKQFAEARILIEQVTADTPRGRLPATRGKLAALEGRCEEALRLFDLAEAEGGAGCVPIEDRALCGAAGK
jgi:hypothetical protein